MTYCQIEKSLFKAREWVVGGIERLITILRSSGRAWIRKLWIPGLNGVSWQIEKHPVLSGMFVA